MIEYRDPLLVEEQPSQTPRSDFALIKPLLDAILLELRRLGTPSVLSLTEVAQAIGNIIGIADKSYQVNFKVGGRRATVYKLIAFANLKNGVTASLSIGPTISNIFDGIPLTGVPVILEVPLESVSVMVHGSTAVVVNGSADSTDGGIFLWGFTLPTFDS